MSNLKDKHTQYQKRKNIPKLAVPAKRQTVSKCTANASPLVKCAPLNAPVTAVTISKFTHLKLKWPRTRLNSRETLPTGILTGHATARSPNARKNTVNVSMQEWPVQNRATVQTAVTRRTTRSGPRRPDKRIQRRNQLANDPSRKFVVLMIFILIYFLQYSLVFYNIIFL
jgi:hypothetical protein